MRYILQLLLFLNIAFFTACSDKNSSTSTGINIAGKAVDNYIKNATVCIDTNKNNDCKKCHHF